MKSSQKDMSRTRNWIRVGSKGAVKIGSQIGEGLQSKIFSGVFNEQEVAVKCIFYGGNTKEVEILRNLNHENIIRIFFTDIDKTNLYIVLELCRHTLKEYVESSFVTNNLTPIKVLEQITEGLYYLHNGQKFCTAHRGLKPSNILFQYIEREKIWRVKISDFGISKEFYGGKTSTLTRVRGTSGYIAPELLSSNADNRKIRKETDMFSLGVIFYYTLSGGKHPYSDDPDDVNAKVRTSEPCLDNLLSDYTGVVESLILSMLQKDYKERISVSEVKCHHIFWTAEKKLDFLQKTSNHLEDRRNNRELINQFELCLDDITCCELWKDVVCRGKPELKRVIEKRRGLEKKTSVPDLLRLIRNWSIHFFDLHTSSELQAELGGKCEFPKGFVEFFTSRFPKLLSYSYDIMKACKDEVIFKAFYRVEGDLQFHFSSKNKYTDVKEQLESFIVADPAIEAMDVDKYDDDEYNVILSDEEEAGVSGHRRLEDVFQDSVSKDFPGIVEFKKFARSSRGLCLDELEIKTVIEDNLYSVEEQKMQMLQLWRSKSGSGATASEILSIVKRYKKPDSTEDIVSVSDGFIFFLSKRLCEHAHVYIGEQRLVTGVRPVAIKLALFNERNQREAEHLSKLSHHSNVVSLIHSGIYQDSPMNKYIFMVMECCRRDNLEDFIKKKRRAGTSIVESQKMAISKQFFAGLEFMHSHDIIHRDLKPSNVLISEDGRFIKICDYGLSKTLRKGRSVTNVSMLRVGTDGYRAPETYLHDVISKKSDVFSSGLVLYAIVSEGDHAYGDDPDHWNSNIKENKNRNLDRVLVTNRVQMQKLLSQMLEFEPRERPTAAEISDNDVFKHITTQLQIYHD